MKRAVVRLIIMVFLVATPSAAHAADELELSLDGRTWSETLPRPLFDEDLRWVPGDSETSSFYVRNAADSPGELTIDVVDTRVESLIETGDLRISARAGSGPWRTVDAPGTQRLVSTTELDSEGTTRVDVRVDFDLSSPNASQVKQLRLDLDVHLVQSADVLDDGASLGDDDDHGLLPGTGGPASWTLLAGVTLLLAGLTIVARRTKDHSHV